MLKIHNTKFNDFISFVKQNINFKLLLIILLFQFIPTIYKTIRIFFLGTLPDENAYNIASNILWLSILYEIIIESIVVPLFFVFTWKKDDLKFKSTFTLLTIIVFTIFFIFTLIIFFLINQILNSMNLNQELLNQSISYIKLEVWGQFFYSFFSYLFLAVSIFKLKKYFLNSLICLFLYTCLSSLFDLFFVSNYDYSLKLSINGIGINSILVNSICSLYFVIYLAFCKRWTIHLTNNNFNLDVFKKYFKLLIISATEVTIRNVCFYLMVIKPINDLNNQGIYWIANNFIWNWLLLPVISVSILIKESFIRNTSKKEFLYQLYFYISLMTFIVVIWIILLPIYKYFIKRVLNVEDYIKVSHLVYILIPFYIFFAFGQIIDSIFINSGKISLYLLQSLFVNLTVYPIFFILWKLGIWKPSLENICIMFGLGMIVHFIINIPLFLFYLKREQKFQIKLFKEKLYNKQNY